jgi:hypothetical protein
MAKDPEWESLANALGRILDGDRAPELAAQLSDPTHQAIAGTVLRLACKPAANCTTDLSTQPEAGSFRLRAFDQP